MGDAASPAPSGLIHDRGMIHGESIQYLAFLLTQRNIMATSEDVNFNEPHPPKENAIEAFKVVEKAIKDEILASRRRWDGHEPRMWEAAKELSNNELIGFDVSNDLVLVSSSPVSYGTIILGKIRIPALQGGHIHVRLSIHDPPNRGTSDITFHSIWTDEGPTDPDTGKHAYYRAIQSLDTPLTFFHE
ncbi:hypothetical protein BKA62DRAFT_667300 [Auriculariales sp. MPI-PUGE-AT-0066]|nr:hypothetical protein BKA62DRAFT_667300 [Auriculariales sp. MPI-PUGE-AT-0066]